MRKLSFIILLFLVTLSPATLAAEEWQGLVVHVVDGDTITVNREGHPVEVRLYGVDAPESNQDFGPEAKAFVEALLLDKWVLVKPVTHD